MKKIYKKPALQIGAGKMGEDIAQGIQTGSGDQLGKQRGEDFSDEAAEKGKGWSEGLW